MLHINNVNVIIYVFVDRVKFTVRKLCLAILEGVSSAKGASGNFRFQIQESLQDRELEEKIVYSCCKVKAGTN